MIISDLDFAAMYRLHMRLSQRPAKPASVWDDKALDVSARAMNSPYSDEFVKRMDLQGASGRLFPGMQQLFRPKSSPGFGVDAAWYHFFSCLLLKADNANQRAQSLPWQSKICAYRSGY